MNLLVIGLVAAVLAGAFAVLLIHLGAPLWVPPILGLAIGVLVGMAAA